MATHYDVRHHARVSSTQDEARLGFHGPPLLVTSELQEAGRGQAGAAWQNAVRALAGSLAFRPAWPPDTYPLLSLVAGLAARDVLGRHLRLKWPNDIVDPAANKVAGLLVEAQRDVVVVGLGANLYWPGAAPGMAALFDSDPGIERAQTLAESWADRFLERVEGGPDQWGRSEYLAVSATVGSTVMWEGGGPGRALDVGEDGALVLDVNGSEIRLRAGEVRTIRSTTLAPD